MTAWITQIDFAVLYGIQNGMRCPVLDVLMPVITALGNAGAVWLLSAGVLLCIRRTRRAGVLLLAGLALGFLIGNLGMKPLFARPRPCFVDSSVTLLVKMPDDFSFPSGHTLSSVIAATVLFRTDRRFGIPAIVLAVLIGFSRLYLFVHYPTDVLASVVLGIGIGLAVWIFGGRGWDRLVGAAERRRAAGKTHRTPRD